jgi:hypothetical protein
VRNHKILILDCITIRVVIALHPDLFRVGKLAIIDGMKNDRQHEQEIIFVDKRTSHRRKNRYSVSHASIQKHRSVSGLANPREKHVMYGKYEEICYSLILPYFMVFDGELERRAEMKLSMDTMEYWRDGTEEPLQLRFIRPVMRFPVICFDF